MNVMLHPVPVPDLAAQFIARPLQLLIGGAWVDAKSGKTFDVFDPSTGQPIAKATEGDAADIDAAVTTARRAFESGSWPSMSPLEQGKAIAQSRLEILRGCEIIEWDAQRPAHLRTHHSQRAWRASFRAAPADRCGGRVLAVESDNELACSQAKEGR